MIVIHFQQIEPVCGIPWHPPLSVGNDPYGTYTIFNRDSHFIIRVMLWFELWVCGSSHPAAEEVQRVWTQLLLWLVQ